MNDDVAQQKVSSNELKNSKNFTAAIKIYTGFDKYWGPQSRS